MCGSFPFRKDINFNRNNPIHHQRYLLTKYCRHTYFFFVMVLLGSYISKSKSYFFSAVFRNTNPSFNHHSFNHHSIFHRNLFIQNHRDFVNVISLEHLKCTNQNNKKLFRKCIFRTSSSLNLSSTAASSSDDTAKSSQLPTASRNDPHTDTIFALSSGGGGEGGTATAVAVIRISGPKSVQALDMLMNPTSYYSFNGDSNDIEKNRKTMIPKPRYVKYNQKLIFLFF